MRSCLTALLLLVASHTLAQNFSGDSGIGLGEQPEFLKVDEAYQLEVALSEEAPVHVKAGQTLRLYWQIAENYYLYQHRFKFKLEDERGALELSPHFPPAKAKNDEFFGDVKVYYDNADITLNVPADRARALLTVTSQGCADAGLCYPPHTQYFDIDFGAGTATPVTKAARTAAQQTGTSVGGASSLESASKTSEGEAGGLWYMLLLAFMGGAILNLMPCVFPVLSLKVLNFANATDHDRHLQSWVYSAGVIVSFVAVAALLIGLQRAGSAIGWGFQLQSPGFVIALAYLFIAMGLSLSGVIELGAGLMNTGSELADRGGLSGSFFTGVLAVVVASPCTAPFMGTALGFAVSQPPLIGLLVFAALGAGMAAPLLLFSYSGAARALMPKPGAWMETLKQFLAFPLYATAIWLLWVAGRQTGVDTMAAVLVGALLLAMALWLWRPGLWPRALAAVCLIGAIAMGSFRGPDGDGSAPAQLTDGHLAWSEQAVADQRKRGKAVFVDVTADWCITCKVNEAAVLNTADITAAFARADVAYLIADWTNRNTEIASLLEQHGRTGIPLYLLYPADPDAPPLLLPQVLTKDTVLQALEAVAGGKFELVGLFPDIDGK